jgi:hypothetical protein
MKCTTMLRVKSGSDLVNYFIGAKCQIIFNDVLRCLSRCGKTSVLNGLKFSPSIRFYATSGEVVDLLTSRIATSLELHILVDTTRVYLTQYTPLPLSYHSLSHPPLLTPSHPKRTPQHHLRKLANLPPRHHLKQLLRLRQPHQPRIPFAALLLPRPRTPRFPEPAPTCKHGAAHARPRQVRARKQLVQPLQTRSDEPDAAYRFGEDPRMP